jgi:hypothetical protein
MTSMGSTSKITIRRDHGADARERQVYARIDNGQTQTLMFGDVFTIDAVPGIHRLRTNNTLFWKTLQFSVESGEHVELILINRCIWEGLRGLLEFFAGAVPLKLQIERLSTHSPTTPDTPST